MSEFLSGEFTLDIPNFEKWNPPIKDKKTGEAHERQNRTYINLSVHFFDDPKIQRLSNPDRTLYLRLVILRATCNKPVTNLTATYLQRLHNMPGRSIVPALCNLLKSGLIILTETTINKEIKKEIKKEEPVLPAWDRLTQKQKEILIGQFDPVFLNDHLTDAVACWDTYDERRRSMTPLIKTVQSYLKNQREKPPVSRNRTLTEMIEAGEVEA